MTYLVFCYVFVRVCLYVLCSHLLGKGWPLGSRLWCLTVSLSLSHWYPGSGVVLDCIDSWSLHPDLLWFIDNVWNFEEVIYVMVNRIEIRNKANIKNRYNQAPPRKALRMSSKTRPTLFQLFIVYNHVSALFGLDVRKSDFVVCLKYDLNVLASPCSWGGWYEHGLVGNYVFLATRLI